MSLPQFMVRTPKQFGKAIRRLRRRKKLRQADVGYRAGVRQATVSSLESGAGGTELATVFAVVGALGLELVIRQKSKITMVNRPGQPFWHREVHNSNVDS